jgi:hypothetical protein
MHSTDADRRGLGENGAQPGLCFFDDLTHAGRSFSISVVVFVRSCPAQPQIFSSILLAPATTPATTPHSPPRDCYRDSRTVNVDSLRAPRRDTIACQRRPAHYPDFCPRFGFQHSTCQHGHTEATRVQPRDICGCGVRQGCCQG